MGEVPRRPNETIKELLKDYWPVNKPDLPGPSNLKVRSAPARNKRELPPLTVADGEPHEFIIYSNKPKKKTRSKKTKKKEKEESPAGTSGRPPSRPSREVTTISELGRKHQDIETERYERIQEDWQQIKEDAKQEDQKHYEQKLKIQKKLIASQDALHRRKVHEKELLDNQQREARKQLTAAKNTKLQDVCRESLEEDRQRLSERRARQSELSAQRHGVVQSREQDHGRLLPRKLTLSRSEPDFAAPSWVPSTTGPLESDDPAISAVSEEPEPVELSEKELEGLPWHHAQLVRLYGEAEADAFLNPKDEKKKAETKAVNPVLRKQGGRAGVNRLWDTLRDESRVKMAEHDMMIPDELKSAFSAFIREGMHHNKTVIKRNFGSGDDVPDIDRLMDQSKYLAIKDLQHKTEMMYRCAQRNEDRTRIMTYNNPLPDINNMQGSESISRYLPSWFPDDDDVDSEASYMKWLRPKLSPPHKAPEPLPDIVPSQDIEPEKDVETAVDKANDVSVEFDPDTKPNQVDQVVPSGTEAENNHEWGFLSMKQPQLPEQTFKFLTEKDAECEGQFSQYWKDLREARERPEGYQSVVAGDKPRSAATILQGGTANSFSSISGSDVVKMNKGRSAPTSASQEFFRRFQNTWQPLSMNALLEYKEKLETTGEGEFHYGIPKRWAVDAKT